MYRLDFEALQNVLWLEFTELHKFTKYTILYYWFFRFSYKAQGILVNKKSPVENTFPTGSKMIVSLQGNGM